MLRAGVSATWAINRNVPGSYDANFNPTTRFTLPAEGNRPVYVSPFSVVPATGAAAWTESRVSPRFGHVSEQRADLRADARVLGMSLSYAPLTFFAAPGRSIVFASLSYVFNDGREQFRGFGSAGVDPREVSWSRIPVSKHVITLSLSHLTPNALTLGLQARVQSGTPYSPMVAGDINGDGYGTDRAFIFDPGTAVDTAVRFGMARLLADAPSTARRCLVRQLGAIARRNSCTGPWAMPSLNLSLTPDPYRFRLGNRSNIQLLMMNVLSGIDQALHGPNRLHGWGQFGYPDPTLLTVRGFSSATNQFKYVVNPLFGSTQFRNTPSRPFMVTLDFRMEVGPDRETQYLSSLLRNGGGDPELTERQVKQRIARASTQLDQFVVVKEAMRLTDEQIDSLTVISRRFGLTRDSIVTSMARYLVALRGNYRGEEVRQKWHTAAVASYKLFLSEARQAIAVLSTEQLQQARHLPQLAGLLYSLAQIRDSDLAYMFRTPIAQLP
jgi:hypothetical protein